MTTLFARHRREEGTALMVAIMLMGVVSILVIVIAAVAVGTTNDSGRDRQRTVAVQAAEAGVDTAYAALQSAGLSLPCTWPASGSESVGSAPNNASYAVTVTYVATDGTEACPLPAGKTMRGALIRSVGTSDALSDGRLATRVMESFVELVPAYDEGFGQAIFSHGQLTLDNHGTVYGNVGPDADIYSNDDVVCSNNQHYQGGVYSQGSIAFTNTCSAVGTLWAKGNVSTSNKSSIGGQVRSSTGSVMLAGNTDVGGTVSAAGSIAWPAWPSTKCGSGGKCFPGTTVPAPPASPFPIIRGDDSSIAEWQDNGWSIPAVVRNTCTGGDATTNPVEWLTSTADRLAGPTILRTDCAMNLVNTKTIELSSDLAIFAKGGFSTSNQVGFASTDGTTRKLYWIVPYEAASSRPCASPGITTDNQFGTEDTIEMFLYSPCDIVFSNQGTFNGQVFGGSKVTIANKFDLHFTPLPVWGVDPTTTPQVGYDVNVVYKRETR